MISAITTLFFCTVIDDAGQTIQIKKPVQRVISLAPHITETLFAVEGGNKIVGITAESNYPQQTKKIPSVGSYYSLDVEKMISLHPDLIITWGAYFSRAQNLFKEKGIPVYVSDPHSLHDISRSMKNFACLLGTSEKAVSVTQHFSDELIKLQRIHQQKNSLRVFYQIGNYSLMTMNKNNWINDAIQLCGGRNIFSDASTPILNVSWEAVFTANPQVVISDARTNDWKKAWQQWQNISAVQKHKLYTVDPDLLERPGPRVIEGVKQLCEVMRG